MCSNSRSLCSVCSSTKTGGQLRQQQQQKAAWQQQTAAADVVATTMYLMMVASLVSLSVMKKERMPFVA
jgi:hypothetical protein